MKVFIETSLSNFEAWSGAKETKETILGHGKESEFEALIASKAKSNTRRIETMDGIKTKFT